MKIDGEQLFQNFMLFLSLNERNLVREALDDIHTVNQDDLLDFLSEHEVRLIPNQENFKSTIMEIAHKELVQEPMFVVVIFREVVKTSQYNCHLMNFIG